MNDFHGIVFAYSSAPELRELVSERVSSSLPFCARYRLIDFSLSALSNAGIHDCGVIMQRDYQSLLDHIGSGKAWDMSRRSGGLKMLPPFGLPEYHRGNYTGTMEALNAVSSYIKSIPQKYIVLILGNLCANIDLEKVCSQHLASGAEITAICSKETPGDRHYRYGTDEEGFVSRLYYDRTEEGEGYPSLETFVINKETLLKMMDECKANELPRFHKDALAAFLRNGGKMKLYMHDGYAKIVRSVDAYVQASNDVLREEVRSQLFPKERPVRTMHPEGVSTYYGVNAKSVNSLVADNCIIEGSIKNCIVFPGVVIGKNTVAENCIIMRNTKIGENVELKYIISDKEVEVSDGVTMIGNEKLPLIIPKYAKI